MIRSENALVVFCEPELRDRGTVNNAMNEILESYVSQFSSTLCIAPGAADPFSVGDLNFFGVPSYSKEKRYMFRDFWKIRRFVKKVISQNQGAIYQFRLPSLFSLQIYIMCADLFRNEKVSFYLAGDWFESLISNYPNRRFLSKILEKVQSQVLKNGIVVFTGDVLYEKHRNIVKSGHVFYSTTHKASDVLDVDTFEKRKKNGICFIGTLDKRKNPDYMIRLANHNFTEIKKFHILGDGKLYSDIKERAGGNVVIHGHISDREKFYNILSECKYFVLPSYTEGTSKTLPEVMSKGLIPIAFKGVGSNDYIINGSNGVLVEVDCVEEAVDAINKIDADDELYSGYLASAQTYAKSRCMEVEIKKVFEFLCQSFR
jgi:glycosyltransferase involved in cell wall biosynthesis